MREKYCIDLLEYYWNQKSKNMEMIIGLYYQYHKTTNKEHRKVLDNIKLKLNKYEYKDYILQNLGHILPPLNFWKYEKKLDTWQITLIISTCYYLLWNILHPTYHNYTGMEKYDWIKSNFIYKYLERYHLIHHLNKGEDKCNFNIILPGIDFLFGTYRGSIDNTEFCNNTVDKTEKEKKICEMQRMNILPRDDIYYC